MELKITERTFGLELEYADVIKRNVVMPQGFIWDKVEVVHNTDGTAGTYNARRGGELNTEPLHLGHSAAERIKQFVESCVENEAYARRDLALQVHIYVGDCTIEEIKRIFFLTYHTSEILKKICHEPPYCDEQRYRPSPTLERYLRIKQCQTREDIQHALENSSNKGYVRYFVNIASYLRRETIEFRLFNSTTDVQMLYNSILFAYKFVDYALKHEEEDFRAIKTEEDFRKQLKFRYELPELPQPLIYFADSVNQNRGLLTHQRLDISNHFISEISKLVGEEVLCVNPRMYSFEYKLSEFKKIIVFNNDELCHIMYLLSKGQLKIKYSDKAEFIQSYNADDAQHQLACFLTFCRLSKFFRKGEYYERKLASYECKIGETIAKAMTNAASVISFFDKNEYVAGTLNDAIARGGYIVFQFDDFGKYRTIVSRLRSNSDYSGSFERKLTQYKGIPANLPQGTTLTMVSTCQWLPMAKIAKEGEKVLYSTIHPIKTALTRKTKPMENVDVSFNVPPSDLVIDDVSKLKLCRVQSKILYAAQQQFIKKVEKVTACRYGFFVMYGDYLLGGIGFEMPRRDGYDLVVRSDFCTNNDVPRLSKLILLVIKSKEMQRALSRMMVCVPKMIYTKVYTQSPVSMKYRGIFNKVCRDEQALVYEAKLGESGTMAQVMEKYNDILKRSKK